MSELNESLRWLERESLSLNYGVVMLAVVIHAGKVTRVEKSITRKEQISEDDK
jgi:hypothetical protein